MTSPVKAHAQQITWTYVALICIVIGSLAFLFLYDNIREQNDIARLDGPTLAWFVGHRSDIVTLIMQALTNIASPIALGGLTVVGSLVWGWRKKEAWRPLLLIGAMGLAVATSTLIKILTGRIRPPLADMIVPFEVDFSFPSGHTLGIAVFVLVAGYLLYSRRPTKKRLVLWIIGSIIGVLLIASSRLYLAYHWITDIGASIGLALIILGIIVLIDTWFVGYGRKSTKVLSSTAL
jgi:undecaprenyl-diphosphatase